MTRKQWLRVCGNLLQMSDTAQSVKARQMFRQQYEQSLAKLPK
ncbi:hypothetical protein [Paenibacillus alvei]|nr:hypothetical protein [Paenibacillus alvei]